MPTRNIVCAYCGSTHPERPVPPAFDDAGWISLAREHNSPEGLGCVWLATRAHQIDVAGTVKIITLRMNTPARVEYLAHNLDDGRTIGYKAIQEIVDGVFQAINLGHGMTLWINDNGRHNGMEPNFAIGRDGRWQGEPICGPALLTSSNTEGDTLGLSSTDIGVWLPHVQQWKRFTSEERQAMGRLPTGFTVSVLPVLPDRLAELMDDDSLDDGNEP